MGVYIFKVHRAVKWHFQVFLSPLDICFDDKVHNVTFFWLISNFHSTFLGSPDQFYAKSHSSVHLQICYVIYIFLHIAQIYVNKWKHSNWFRCVEN
jgi:hypothetical protein